MVCSATLTGSTAGNNVTATVNAVVLGNQILFTVTNNTPGTLIDEFFFELEGPFRAGLTEGDGTRANWDFESDINGVQPNACGNFRYKFGTNVPGARIGNLPGIFVLESSTDFPADILDDQEVCVRFQQVGPSGSLSVCACGVFDCPPVTTTTTTQAPPMTTTTTQAPPMTTTTLAPAECPLLQPVADMEAALVQVLLLFVQSGNLAQIDRILRLIIKKEILLEMLLDECPIIDG